MTAVTSAIGRTPVMSHLPRSWKDFSVSGQDSFVWEREVLDDFTEWLDALPANRIPHGRTVLKPSDTLGFLDHCFTEAATPRGHARDSLGADVCQLVSWFAGFMSIDRVSLRLDKITDDACWRFHQDNVRARALCTYRGDRTQYVATDLAEQALAEQQDYRGPIDELPRFGVVLLKGLKATRRAAVHRSPPINGSGQTRLVLCLNEPREPGACPC